jgi:hypothetical protein
MRRQWWSQRWSVLGLALLSIVLAAGVTRAEPALETRPEAAIEVRTENGCLGFVGTLKRNGELIAFESRVTPGGAESRILSSSGEVLTEVIVDESAGIFEYRAGGVALSEDAPAEETERAMRTFDGADAALAAEHLWPALVKRGYDPESRAMAALAANLAGYAVVPRQRLQSNGKEFCLGCCGPSCWGCTGCYTSACLAHDVCVMTLGYTNPQCNRLLALAALSAWCCRGVHLGSLC